MAMDGAFSITYAPSPVAPPSPAPTPDSTTEAGFLDALTRSLNEVSAAQGVPVTAVAETVTPNIPPQAVLQDVKARWAGQAPLALGVAGELTAVGALVVDPAVVLEVVGENAAVSLQPLGAATPTRTPQPAHPATAGESLGPLSEWGNTLESKAIAPDPAGGAMPPDTDAIPPLIDAAALSEKADEDTIAAETSDLAPPDEDAIAGEAVAFSAMPDPSHPKPGTPTPAPINETGTASSLPVAAGFVPIASQLLSPQIPAAAIAPSALAMALAGQPGVQLRPVTLQALPTREAPEAMALKSLDLLHPNQSVASPPDDQRQPNDLDALRPAPEAMPEAVVLAASVATSLPLRSMAQQHAPGAADAVRAEGLPVELGIASSATQPFAASGFLSRSPEAPVPPPMRQLAPIAIALAFTPGAANGFNLTLDPVELGRVEIRVQRESDGHSVRIMAERPETLALLQRDRHELDRSLADAGLRVASDGIDFSLGSSGAGQDAPREDGARPAVRGSGGAGTAELKTEPLPVRAIRGLLDLNI